MGTAAGINPPTQTSVPCRWLLVRPSAVTLALRKKESGKAERAEWGNVVPREGGREEGRAVKPEKCAARHVFDGRTSGTTQCGRGRGNGWRRCHARSLARALPVPALDMRQEPQAAGGQQTPGRQRSHVGLRGSGLAGGVCTFGRE